MSLTSLPQYHCTFIAPATHSASPALPLDAIRTAIQSYGGLICNEQWLDDSRALDITCELPEFILFNAGLQEKCMGWGIDIIIQPTHTRAKKLLISDMDSTIINQECIDELADVMGLKDKVSAITARAMNGELDFAEALSERVGLLKGLPVSEMQRVLEQRITLMAGARTLIQTLRARGVHCVLVSGGFTFFTEAIAARTGFHAHEANILLTENDVLTGAVALPILGKEAKRASLIRIASEHGIALSETIAIGDGANDMPMILEAGLGIAYHAKPSVEAAATHRIRFNDLTALLFSLGIPDHEWATSN